MRMMDRPQTVTDTYYYLHLLSIKMFRMQMVLPLCLNVEKHLSNFCPSRCYTDQSLCNNLKGHYYIQVFFLCLALL